MSSGFVKTSVLQEGELFHGDEKRLDTDDVRRQTYMAKQASSGTLHDQLESRKQEKQDEYDAITRQMRDGAVGGIDEEEAKHLNDLEERQRVQKELARAQEMNDIDSFRAARLGRTLVTVKPDNDDDDDDDDDGGGGRDGQGGGGGGAGEGGRGDGGSSSSSSSSSSGSGVALPTKVFPNTTALVETKVTIKRGKRRLPGAGGSGGGGGGATASTSSAQQGDTSPKKAKKVDDKPAGGGGGGGGGDDGSGGGDSDAGGGANPLAALGGYGSGSDSD